MSAMQGILRHRQLLQRNLQQIVRHRHVSTSARRPRNINDRFFSSRPVARTSTIKLGSGIFRRAFANGRPPPTGTKSARQVAWAIIGLNTAVFGVWRVAIVNHDEKLLRTMNDNFTSSLRNIREGRYHTLLTSAFSHANLTHFLFNMFTFHAFITVMTSAVPQIGGLHILGISLCTAIAGSAGALEWNVIRSRSDTTSSWASSSGLGASGMVMGAGAVATCLMPFAPMNLMFIPIDIPLFVIMLAYAAVDTYYLPAKDNVGHAAHLGGFAMGAVYYALSLRKFGGVWHSARALSRRR